MAFDSGRLNRLRYLFGPGHEKWPNADFGLMLAAELDWRVGYANIDPVPVPSLPSVAHRGFIGKTPAVLFATEFSDSDLPVHEIASYAYQSSIEWGLVTNRAKTVVFNSHWSKNRDWFQLPFGWESPESLAELLSAFTPDGVQKGTLEATARRFLVEDDRLSPVDDALVDLLDAWRDEAFESAASEDGIDEAVQTLFSQLFILRAIEDRGLAPAVPSIGGVLRPGAVADLDALHAVFTAARNDVQSDLFDEHPYLRLPPFIVGGIIRDLYRPATLPIEKFKYNFAWITADVLGRAYEKYLSSIIVARPKADRQMSMFGEPRRESKRVSRRREGGVYYTPHFVVQYLTKRCIEQHFRRNPLTYAHNTAEYRLPKIVDPSCGSGSFLTAAVDVLIARLKTVRPAERWGRRLVEDRCIVGVDKDPRAVRLAQLSVWLRLAEEPDPLPLPSLKHTIRVGDSLSAAAWEGLPGSFDIALGNPPFIPAVVVGGREALERHYSVARGRFDLAHVFLELCDKKLGLGGLLGMVVPNRVFTSRDAAAVRSLLAHDFDMLTVVDFGSSGVFPDADTYVGLLVAEKVKPAAASRPRLRYMRVRAIPKRFPEYMLESADASGHEFQNSHVAAFHAPQPPADDFWYFLSPARRAARIAVEQDSVPLGDVAQVRQGIKTGANDLFVVEVLSWADRQCRVRNGLGDQALLETACLHPVVYGQGIQRYDLVRATRYVIYPYRDNKVIGPELLRREFPLLHQYFEANKEALLARRNIADRNKVWYELAEKRSINWLTSRKLLSRELAQESSFALDDDGATFLIGGVAVLPADDGTLEPLLAYLNSRFVTDYLAERAPEFASAFLKVEPQVLERLPVPNQLLKDEGIRSRLAGLAVEVCRAAGGEDDGRAERLDDQINGIIDEITGGRSSTPAAAPMPEWLTQAVILDSSGETPRAMDALYDGFDRLLAAGEFDHVNGLLNQLPLERISLSLMVGALSMTLPVASRSPARRAVFARAWSECELQGKNPKKILDGLREWSRTNGEGLPG